MNNGILTQQAGPVAMPYGLLGNPTPVPLPEQELHPEAFDWLQRCVANGGNADLLTLTAMSNFCQAIDAAQIRDRFVRLNLFCGANLSACLVPLYRSPSRSAVIGNATDSNFNFVNADFANLGRNAGLKGNGSSKYLTTGVLATSLPPASCHMSCSGKEMETSGDRIAMGTVTSSTDPCILDIYSNYVSGRTCRIGTTSPTAFFTYQNPGTSELHLLGTRTSVQNLALYRSGGIAGANSTFTFFSQANLAIPVFALNQGGAIAAHTASRLRMYSMGLAMNAAQVAAFSSAVMAFNAALSRT